MRSLDMMVRGDAGARRNRGSETQSCAVRGRFALTLHCCAEKLIIPVSPFYARFDNGSMGPPIRQGAEPRRHHYVPQCWLAGFTGTGENDGRLWVTDFSRQRQWPTTPANAGHIRDFYRLADPAPDPVAVELFFSRLEGLVAPVLRALDTERRPPNDDELDLLLHFIAYQWVRVPRFRPFVLGVLERFTRERMTEELRTPETWRSGLIEAGMDPDAPGADYENMKRFFESGEYSITAETDWYLQRAFSDIDGLVETLRRRYWGTSITPQGRLIASDNPVVMEGERGQMIGFANAELITYPVISSQPACSADGYVGACSGTTNELQLLCQHEHAGASQG